MKKIANHFTVVLTALVLLTGFAMGAVTENFDAWSDGSYGTVSTYDHSGVGQWETYNSMTHADNARSGNAVRFNDDSSENEYLLYKGLDGNGKDGGIGIISFYYRHWDADGSGCQFQVQYSTNAGSNWTNVGSVVSATSTTYSQFSNAVNITNDNVLIKVISIDDNERLLIDDFSITDYSGTPTPLITLSALSLSDFTYEVGNGPSEEQTFTASGSDLTEDIVLTAPTNYEISKSTGSNFTTDTLKLPQYGGSVSAKTIYVRLKSGLSIGDYNSEDITATSSGATSKTVTCNGSVTAVLPNIVINEILADPNGTTGDANGDETVSSVDDEFIELVNKDGSSVDISGWKIFDGVGERHVFPEGTILANNTSIIVFGGGTPTGIPGLSQTASTGALGLNNSGDDVIVKNSTDDIVVSYTYGSDAGYDQSIARDPDFTGSFVKHSTITENPVDFSPGYMNAASDTPLPITLTSFTASAVNGTVELAWETASETNNARFVIYRNGEAIGSVEGAGTTTEPQNYTFVDDAVVPGVTYTYVLADVDYANTETKYEDEAVTVTLGNDVLEADFVVGAAYPNPFNPRTVISMEYAVGRNTVANIYNTQGVLVDKLINGFVEAGHHNIIWDASNMTSGVYILQVLSGDVVNTQKLVLMK